MVSVLLYHIDLTFGVTEVPGSKAPDVSGPRGVEPHEMVLMVLLRSDSWGHVDHRLLGETTPPPHTTDSSGVPPAPPRCNIIRADVTSRTGGELQAF